MVDIFFLDQSILFLQKSLFRKYGEKIVFVGRLLPVVRTFSLPAGIGRTNFSKFAIYTLAGSLIWNTILTYAGLQLGHNWRHIDRYSRYLDIIAVIVIIAFVIWILYNIRKKS